MENIKQIITEVENLKRNIGEADLSENGYAVHSVEGSDIEVFFAETGVEEPNGLDDMYDYDKVVAYRIGSQITWI